MGRIGRSLLAGVALMAFTALPGTAVAEEYEELVGGCSYPKLLDLMFIRPVAFSAVGLGTGLFIAAAPWAILTARDDFGSVYEALVAEPAHFTFRRPLGQCAGKSGL